MAARNVPMIKVMLITELILIPISWEVSKSLDAARMAMPIFVFLIRSTRATTRMMVRTGVIKVTRLVVAPSIVTVSLIQGIVGYCWESPPVTYSAIFCSR